MAFKALLNAKARPFPSLCSSFLCAFYSKRKKKLPERAPTKKTATCTVDYRSTTCVGTSTIRLRSIKSSLPFSLPLRHSRDKLFQALSRFSVLKATESWAGPGNEANTGSSGIVPLFNQIHMALLFQKQGYDIRVGQGIVSETF